MTTTDRAAELLAELDSEVSAMVSGEDWAHFLEIGAKLHRYSFGNVLLARAQRADVSMLAGYQAWRKMGRQVRKGERAISILAPMRAKRTDDDGTEHYFVRGFKAASVFDIAQTDGPELPARPELIEGSAPDGAMAAVVGLIEREGYAFERGDCYGANGFTSPERKLVRVRDDVDDAQAFKTAAHELAHILLEHVADYGNYVAHRGTAEIEAESVAFVVAGALGLSTSGYSFPYVAIWADGKAEAVRKTGERVMSTAKALLAAIDGPGLGAEAAA